MLGGGRALTFEPEWYICTVRVRRFVFLTPSAPPPLVAVGLKGCTGAQVIGEAAALHHISFVDRASYIVGLQSYPHALSLAVDIISLALISKSRAICQSPLSLSVCSLSP